jgi:hypothetical protein
MAQNMIFLNRRTKTVSRSEVAPHRPPGDVLPSVLVADIRMSSATSRKALVFGPVQRVRWRARPLPGQTCLRANRLDVQGYRTTLPMR